MSLVQKISPLLFLPLFSFCGSNPTLQLELTGATAFADANVADIVFTIQNVPTAAGGLDQDKDGVADVFIYPKDCGSAKPALCGFAAESGNITVGDIPLDYTYEVTVQLRNNAGAILYDGQKTFENTKNAAAVEIAVD